LGELRPTKRGLTTKTPRALMGVPQEFRLTRKRGLKEGGETGLKKGDSAYKKQKKNESRASTGLSLILAGVSTPEASKTECLTKHEMAIFNGEKRRDHHLAQGFL